MVCHVALFAGLVYVPRFEPDRTFRPSVIDVSIVSLASLQGVSPETEKDAQLPGTKPQPKISRARREKAPDNTSASPSAYRRKTSLKKKTFKPGKVVKRAISEIEEKLETSRAEPVEKAIDDLRKAVAGMDDNATVPETQSPGVSEEQGRRALELRDIYRAEIPYQIQKNWSFSEQLAGGRTDLVAWLIIEIRPDGSIRDIWFEKRSGNRYFDDQAFKAVKKSSPLPPLPKGYIRPFFNVGLRFTPSGLR